LGEKEAQKRAILTRFLPGKLAFSDTFFVYHCSAKEALNKNVFG
jgi:hypothetical protein